MGARRCSGYRRPSHSAVRRRDRSDTYVAGGLAVAHDGTIYYNAIKLDHDDPFGGASQAWLVAVSPAGATQIADYETPFFITELDSSLNVVWKFQNTNMQSCVRLDNGTTSCTDNNPYGFEWCVNAPAVDRDGTVYANSEDGNVYAITSDGQLREAMFLDRTLAAAYTPIAIDQTGRVFALNSGRLAVPGGK